MRKSNSKVVQLHRQMEEFDRTTSETVSEIFPGFSMRLNQLIDQTDLDIPPLNAGRQAHVASLLRSSKMASGDWLKKDKPPKTTTLRRLVSYFLSHIAEEHSALKIEAWLKYGEEAMESPFWRLKPDNDALIPLATSLIVSVARESELPAHEIDLNRALSATIDILAEFRLTREGDVEPVHRKIIAQLIKTEAKR